MNYQLEICCTSLADALAAQNGGADRIELCTSLDVGGLTPDNTLLQEVAASISIPVFVLIRSRAGNFEYSEEELQQMLEQINQAREAGAHGIVCGALQADGQLHVDHTRQMVETAGSLPFTFHRAFDVCTNQEEAIDQLAALGARRILTSGGKPSAVEGAESLQQFMDCANGRLTIMAGGGVRPENLQVLLDKTLLTSFHSAARAHVSLPASIASVSAMKTILETYFKP